jgi:hydroxypyruvate isomerase
VTTILAAKINAIRHIQIAGAPGRHEPDTGALDYGPVFALIDRLGYRGWVGCEYQPAARTEDGLGWMSSVA